MKVRPTLVASEKGYKGALVAAEALRNGGSALDAVEMACRIVEDDPNEHTVGYGGLPSILGEVELEASIMDGQSLRVGAVAGVRGYGNMISLARVVMEELPHVLVVAHGAQRLAAECSHVPVEQRTLEAMQKWHDQFEEAGIRDLNQQSLRDLADLSFQPGEYLNIVALAPDGQHAGFSTNPDKQYIYWHDKMAEPVWADRISLASTKDSP
jgi:beta-aspartyl-peptidase (threonine type)